jgi:hypothetical protein
MRVFLRFPSKSILLAAALSSLLSLPLSVSARGKKSDWLIQKSEEPVTRVPRILAFNSHSSPLGSFLRIECNSEGVNIAFLTSYRFKKAQPVRAVTKIGDFPIVASIGKAIGDSNLVGFRLSRLSYQRLTSAARVDVQMMLPNDSIAAYSYELTDTPSAVEPIKLACPEDKAPAAPPALIGDWTNIGLSQRLS